MLHFKKNHLFFIFIFFQSYLNLSLAGNSQTQIVDREFILKLTSKKNAPSTPEKFLEALPTSFLKSYSVQFQGQALQESSQENPRIFLFDLMGGTVLTVNNDSHHRQFKGIEIFTYNKTSEEFDLIDINFEEKKPRTTINPPICMACHGSGYNKSLYKRPIFGGLGAWKGFFGSNLEHDASKNEFENSYIKKFNEKVALKNSTNNRYQYLKSFFPMAPELNLSQMTNRPNHQIMNLFEWYSSRSIQFKLSQHPFYKKIIPWIALFYIESDLFSLKKNFGEIDINDLENKGCFENNSDNKEAFLIAVDNLKNLLGKTNIYFSRGEVGTLKLLSIFEALGFPSQALTLSLGLNESKKFHLGANSFSPIAFIPGQLLKDFFQYFVPFNSNNLSFHLDTISAHTILSQIPDLPTFEVNTDYSSTLDNINQGYQIKYQGISCEKFIDDFLNILKNDL